MREWEQVRHVLAASIQVSRTVKLYADMAREHAPLAQFETPVALTDFLQRLQKDAVTNPHYLAIVDVWRRGSLCHSDLAGRLLWLGLWPLLNALYWRQAKHWSGRENDLTSEIGRCLVTVLRATELSHVESVALTLMRDTERDVVELRQAELAEAALVPVESWPEVAWALADVDGRSFAADDDDDLEAVLGSDFELARAAYENGCDYETLGREFRLDAEEIRRRLRRALRRVRKRLARKNRIE
jgi:hypothetical protein